jgi:hypothetical protein
MNEMIAFCGLDCGSCPIHLATLEQDKSQQYAMRSIAEQLSKYYGTDSHLMIVTVAGQIQEEYLQMFTMWYQAIA